MSCGKQGVTQQLHEYIFDEAREVTIYEVVLPVNAIWVEGENLCLMIYASSLSQIFRVCVVKTFFVQKRK